MPKRDFLAVPDLSKDEILELFRTAGDLKSGVKERRLAGQTLAMIFTKSSTRTRVSFETGMYQLGGNGLFIMAMISRARRAVKVPTPASQTALPGMLTLRFDIG